MINMDNDFYKEILENTSEGIFVCNDKFEIIYANKSILELTQYNINEMTNNSLSNFIAVEGLDCPICHSKSDSVFAQDEMVHQAEIKTKNNELTPVKVSHRVISNTDSRLYITSVSALSDMACLNQAHVDFVSTVSHELRTPLTSIRGFADTLISAGDMLPKEQQLRFFKIIRAQVDRLTRLVENLLTVSRLDSQKDKSICRSIKIKDIIEPVVQMIQKKAPSHRFEIDIPESTPEIFGDSDKLEQVLTNLIDNATKYSYPESLVTINVCNTPDNNDYLSINVIDEGVGIPADKIDNIFTQFSRIDNPLTREVQGTGLGLYITKTIIDKMNGKIIVRNNEQMGATFEVQLPIATCEMQAQKFSQEGGL